MVKFEYHPYKKVIIHQIIKIPQEQLVQARTIGVEDGGTTQPILWVDGLFFEHAPTPFTEDVIKEQIQGIIHWSCLTYGYMEEFKVVLEGPRKIKVPIIKSEDVMFTEMANWIKNVYEKELE